MEKEVVFGTKDQVYGTLTLPGGQGKHPAILLIAGSGPLDRDGNDSKGKYRTNLYRELAEFFTGLGFATLRYGKRGTGKSTGNWLATGLTELLEDAHAAVDFLQNHPDIFPVKVVIAGHSEGTIVATAVCSTREIGGAIFLSGGVDNLTEALRKQRELGNKELLAMPVLGAYLRFMKVEEKSEKQAAKMMETFKKSKEDIVKIQLFFKQPAKWYREHDEFDTREALKSVSCPILAIVGDKDPLADPEVLKELPALAKGEAEYAVIKDMEHGLRIQTEELSILKSKKRFKGILKRPLHPDALAKMERWLEEIILVGISEEKVV